MFISALLVCLATVLFFLYNLFIATLAFIGFFLLFGLMIGKQYEMEMALNGEGGTPNNITEAAAYEKDELLFEAEKEEVIEGLRNKEDEESLWHQEDEQFEKRKMSEKENSEDNFDYFEAPLRRTLLVQDDEQILESPLLGRGASNEQELEEDLPIRIPYQEDDESDEHELIQEAHRIDEKVTKEVMTNRQRLFDSLEENERLRVKPHE
ncbi:hypothetical protein IQ10_01794 [Halalkalibacter nanhaiisediminis]|uniref:Uncharacterized protein n=1 Tax=Halalkalibacter nanhaiisediminis TaxID=688079 RepID=A0A562QK34_9BACI|nr:hypothetical protein IQ10_01794 [Halalkalibacter nanhaiisediminis]